jgi:hypothetical protein
VSESFGCHHLDFWIVNLIDEVEEFLKAREVRWFWGCIALKHAQAIGHRASHLSAEAAGRDDIADAAVSAGEVFDGQDLADERLAAAGRYREDHAAHVGIEG